MQRHFLLKLLHSFWTLGRGLKRHINHGPILNMTSVALGSLDGTKEGDWPQSFWSLRIGKKESARAKTSDDGSLSVAGMS